MKEQNLYITKFEKEVRTLHLNAQVADVLGFKYILDNDTGIALSPMCPGEDGAWRWAWIAMTFLGDQFKPLVPKG